MLRGIGSLLAGFLLLPMLMRVGLVAVTLVAPDLLGPVAETAASAPAEAPSGAGDPAGPTATFMTVNLALTVVMASISAAVTAALAPEPPYLWVLLLAFLVFAGGLVFGVGQLGGPSPTWYLLALPLASGVAIAAGGWGFLTWKERPA